MGQSNLMEHPSFHQFLKKVISHDRERAKKEGCDFTFSQLLLQQIEKQDSLDSLLSCNRGAFVLVNMFETEVEQVATDLKKALNTQQAVMAKFKSKGIEMLTTKIG